MHTTTTTTETELPEDLIEEILLRLPIKSLIKFKTVSKQWLRLITSNRFAFKQCQIRTFDDSTSSSFFVLHNLMTGDDNKNFITPVSVGIGCGGALNPKIDLPYAAKMVNWNVHELFPAGFGIYFIFERTEGTVLLWNPTTRETKVLPSSPYYPSTSIAYAYHFGTFYYKDGNFSYKVCRVTSQKANSIDLNTRQFCLSLELYSSETNSWKLIPNFCSDQFEGYADWTLHCSNLNGRAHWLIRSRNEDTFITTFDYQTEVFSRIRAPSAPPEVGDYDKRRCIVTLFDDKFLCLLLFWGKNNKEFVDIWVMCQYGVEDSWTKESTVGPIPMDREVLAFSSKVRAMFLQPRGNDTSRLILFYCNSLKGKRHRLGRKHRYQNMQVVEYKKSLVSLLE
ncbi:unnamed protein product [Rhodiola kirilowii]